MKTIKFKKLDFDKIMQNIKKLKDMNMEHYKDKQLYELRKDEYISDD